MGTTYKPAGAGSMELVEAYKCGSEESSKTFTFALDWDLYSHVIITYAVIAASGTFLLKVNCNGNTSAEYDYQVTKSITTNVTTANTQNDTGIVLNKATAHDRMNGQVIITRNSEFVGFNWVVNGRDSLMCQGAGMMDTDINLTSIEFTADGNWKIGSYVTVHKVKRT